MDVILHIGAHRTASTSLQAYMRKMQRPLQQVGVGFWGPYRLRGGMLHGVIPNLAMGHGAPEFQRAQGRIALHLNRSQQLGLSSLIVSDENLLGTMRHNISSHLLYPDAGDRVARFVSAFRGQVRSISLHIRALDGYWASAVAFCLPRGVHVPSPEKVARFAAQPRNWRDVITEIAQAAPNVPITVVPFERFASKPDAVLRAITHKQVDFNEPSPWRNKRPSLRDLLDLPLSMREAAQLKSSAQDGPWTPFSPIQRAALRERYADDLFWLHSGADGLATILEEPNSDKTGLSLQPGFTAQGQRHDTRQRLARPG